MKFAGLRNPGNILFISLALGVQICLAQGTIKSGISKWSPSQHIGLKGSTSFFEIFEMNVVTLEDGKTQKKEVLPDYEELIIIKEGKLEIGINGETKPLGPGSTAFFSPTERYTYSSIGGDPTVFYLLKFKSNNTAEELRGKMHGGSFIVDWNSVQMKKSEKGGRRDFFNRPTATCRKFEMHVTTLNEGLPSHAPHTHTEEEVIVMIKGDVTMEIAGKSYNASPGDFIFVASNELHGLKNTGKGQCEYFAFQWK